MGVNRHDAAGYVIGNQHLVRQLSAVLLPELLWLLATAYTAKCKALDMSDGALGQVDFAGFFGADEEVVL